MDDITAEYAADSLSAAPALRVRTRATVAAKTDLGRVRENNEDKFEFYVPEDEATLARRGSIYIVCDGMGGHAAGQIASELAAKTFIDVYLHHPAEDPAVGMLSGVQAANRFVTDIGLAVPSRRGMGTTFSGLVLLQDRAFTVQVGDSRIYRLRNDELLQLTFDHTYVDEMVRAGLMTPADAETHPSRHVLTRAIGGDMEVVPEIESHDLHEGDIYLLCSDGLTNHVDDNTLQEVLRTYSPSEACWRLVGAALLGGGSDNCTVLVVRVDEIRSLDG
jgi:protein phosphatase